MIRTWDDDDLYLPWTITQGVAHLGHFKAFKPSRSWFHHGGHGYRLESNCFEAAMTVRRDTAMRYRFKESGGDEHHPLLRGIEEERGGRLREFGVWSPYCYTWGIGNTHVSGTIGQGTEAERTAAWNAANNDTADYTIRPVDMTPVWNEMKDFCGNERHEWFAAATGKPVPAIECPKTEQYTRLLDTCFPENSQIRVLEFGRLRAKDVPTLQADGGSTLQLCRSLKVRSVFSCDTDEGTLEACRATIPEDLIQKVNFHRHLSDCSPCAVSKSFDLLIIDANDNSLQNLDLLRQSTGAIKTQTVIAVDDTQHKVKPLLIREVLRPTHQEQRIGDLAVFTRRQVPEWFSWPVQM